MVMKCSDQRSDCLPERFGEMANINKPFVVRQVLALQNNFSGVDTQAPADDVPFSYRHVGPACQCVSQSTYAQVCESGNLFDSQLPAEYFVPDHLHRRVNVIFHLV